MDNCMNIAFTSKLNSVLNYITNFLKLSLANRVSGEVSAHLCNGILMSSAVFLLLSWLLFGTYTLLHWVAALLILLSQGNIHWHLLTLLSAPLNVEIAQLWIMQQIIGLLKYGLDDDEVVCQDSPNSRSNHIEHCFSVSECISCGGWVYHLPSSALCYSILSSILFWRVSSLLRLVMTRAQAMYLQDPPRVFCESVLCSSWLGWYQMYGRLVNGYRNRWC